MHFNEYQNRAIVTAVKRAQELGWMYAALGIAGEAGEVAEKVKKTLRDHNGDFSKSLSDIEKELGDLLWYIAFMCSSLGIDLEDVAKTNLDKLDSRKKRGVLRGNGDDR